MMVWCARWYPREYRDNIELSDTKNPQYCAIQRQSKPPPKYADSLATMCGQFVMLTGGIVFCRPTCPECLVEVGKAENVRPRRKGRNVSELDG